MDSRAQHGLSELSLKEDSAELGSEGGRQETLSRIIGMIKEVASDELNDIVV